MLTWFRAVSELYLGCGHMQVFGSYTRSRVSVVRVRPPPAPSPAPGMSGPVRTTLRPGKNLVKLGPGNSRAPGTSGSRYHGALSMCRSIVRCTQQSKACPSIDLPLGRCAIMWRRSLAHQAHSRTCSFPSAARYRPQALCCLALCAAAETVGNV